MKTVPESKVEELEWRLPCERPETGSKVIVEQIDGMTYIFDPITENFDRFGDTAIRWAYV